MRRALVGILLLARSPAVLMDALCSLSFHTPSFIQKHPARQSGCDHPIISSYHFPVTSTPSDRYHRIITAISSSPHSPRRLHRRLLTCSRRMILQSTHFIVFFVSSLPFGANCIVHISILFPALRVVLSHYSLTPILFCYSWSAYRTLCTIRFVIWDLRCKHIFHVTFMHAARPSPRRPGVRLSL